MNKSLIVLSAVSALVAGAALSGPAVAKVRVGVAVGAPVIDECVEYRKHHHHKVVLEQCDAPVYTGDPVVIEGVTYHDNLHFRMRGGHREFFVKGKWVVHD